MRKIDRGATQHLIIHSNLIDSLLQRASESEQDLALRLQCTTFLIDLWFEESGVLCNLQPTSHGL